MTLHQLTGHQDQAGAREEAFPRGSTRDDTMSRLLDDAVAVRRATFAEAVSRRWLDRGVKTVVRAVLIDDRTNVLQRQAFGRHLAAATPTQTTFIRDHEGFLYLVTRDTRAGFDLDAWIRDESVRQRMPLLSIGSASHDPVSDDLADAAEQARVAAELTAAVPELPPTANVSDLGGWLLLHAVATNSRRLSDISPAAEELCRAGESVQRQTIETYLDAGCQARVACERLHIHRTTLYYRLDNMPEVVREALDDGLKRSTLHLTLKLIRLWAATGAL
ncbi:helix-turn-helix domain-containing protein [Herbiconiux daphne]|uniref:Helix-turn-helix domain-containing protein n=1 Tax=Herbiconiux daphne TaxID=2970914 RepID=A0ABT2H4C5_9MICO|nr:helix-turn-helix domain-containing protein [Herbiconiux daphne]MCS5734790.1 helix-turn-helix domain-containing protein [Herbiconiux daphne]